MSLSVNRTSFAVIVSFLCIALVGAIMLPMLTVRLHPLRYNPSITVNFSLPGSSARVVEMEATSKLEGLLARMKGVSYIQSSSSNGGGSIWVYLDKHANIDALRLEASSIVRQAWPDLPDGTSYPQVTVNTPSEGKLSPFLTYTINAPETPASIQRYAEEYIQPLLSRVKGIYKVSVSGASPMEWHLTYNPQQLETLGITYSDIQGAISSYYGTEFIGKVRVEESGWHQLAITPEKSISDKLPLERMFVKNKDGRLLRVSELVSVLHVESAPQSFYRINGLNSIYLSITADENANQITLGEEIKSMMKELEAAMPKGYETHIGYDATEYIDKELDKIYFRCGLTVLILLLFVLLMTRQWKYTFLVVTSLAVNLLIAVVIYYFAGIDIQLYTLAGITISLNLIIDNTIVMTDHILQRKNMKAYLAILAATLTTICALGVVLFLDEGLRAKLLDFAIVVIINLAVSLAVALFFVPAMMDRLGLKKRKTRGKRAKRMIVHITRIYGKMIGFTCRHKVWACVILVLVFGLPLFLIPEKMEDDKGWHKWYNETLGSDYYKEKIKPIVNTALGGTWRLFVEKVYNGSYFDEKHETVLHVNATLPNGSTLEQMNNLIARMEEILKGYSEIKQFHTQVHSAYRASIDIYFPEEHQYSSFPYRLKSEITSRALELGGGSWSVYGLEDQGFNNDVRETAGSYKVRLKGYNYDQLYEYAETLKDSLLTHRRVRDVEIGAHFKWYKDDYREFLFDVSTKRLAEADITPMELYNSMRGIFARDVSCGNHRSADGTYEAIRLSSSQANRYDTWQLSYNLLQSGEKEFKLYSLADIGITPQASEVVKYNQRYELCLQYEYVGAYRMGTKMLERELKKFNKWLPTGYEANSEMGGGYWSSKDNSQYLLLLLIAAVIFIVTSIQFNSLRKPFAILFVIPVSFIGVFLTFWLFELNFDQGGFAAMILLCGITVNAAIYLLDEYGNIRERHPQMDSIRAYLKAWNVKIVPIMLTIISTILGFVPFIIGSSKEGFWFPLAAGTIGGLLMSLVGIFIFLPIYALKVKRINNNTMTRQKIIYIIKTTATALVAFCLLWLTLLDVHTGWCEELPVLLNAMLVIGGVAFVSVIFKKQMCKICWLDKTVLLWFVYITFNYWFISPYPAGERYFVFLSSLLLYILLRYTLAKDNKYILLLALCIGGIYEAILGVMQLMGWEYSRHSMFDITGTFFNPGPFSAYLVVALAVATAYIYRRRKLYNYPYFKKGMPARRILSICIYIICGITLFVTAITLPATWSRAAFVAYFIVLLVLFYKKHKKWVLGLVCISTIVGVFLYFAKQGSANGRVLMNIVSMRAIESKPLLGYGIGGFANAFADSQAEYFKENPDSPFVEVAGSPEYAFNELLQIGVEQGVIGMLFFIVIATGSMIVLLRNRNELAYGWLALLVFSLFSYPFSLQPFRIVAVLFVASAANIISKEKDRCKIICKLPHIALIALCIVIVCCITPRVKNKVNTTKDWERISGYQSAAFADDYAECYNTLIDNPKFLFTYGKMLNGMKRYNDSNAALRDGMKVSADPMFYVVMGNNYKELGAYKEAEECYTKAFYINPNKMYPLYQLLQMYIGLNNEVNAKAMAQRIVDFNPKIRSSATDDMKDYAKEYLKKIITTKTNNMDREEKLLWFRTASQLFLGLTFVVSGVLKAIDIYGTELKLIEYAGSTGFAFLCEYNMLLSVALCSFEIFLGLWLMTFVYRKISLSVLVATMLFFSGVIIYLIINPDKNITDCGCFGEMLPMGMLASLVKNVVILLLGCYLLWSVRKGDMFFHKDLTLVVLACLTASLLLPLYTADNLSLYNPTGYGTGVNLADKKDFTLLNDDFEEVTDSLLGKTEKVYVFVLKEQPEPLENYNMKEISQKCKKENANCFALTSEEYELPDGVTQYFTDAVTLKSLVRSKENGILTLKNGVITNVMKLNDY